MESPDWRILEFDRIDSTQDELRRRLVRGEDIDYLVVRASMQSQGRGQRGRDWLSEPGGSWQSVGFKGFALPASSLFMGIGIVNELSWALSDHRLKLKWPNDILSHQGHKIAGILCEYRQGHLLVGVGVNVNNEPPEGAGALTGLPLSVVQERVLAGTAAGWQMMHLRPEELASSYARLDSLHGQRMRFERGGQIYEGIASGVDVAGRLRLLTGEGELLIDSATKLRPVPEG